MLWKNRAGTFLSNPVSLQGWLDPKRFRNAGDTEMQSFACTFSLFLVLLSQVVVSGKILDREGKPLAKAKVVYTETSTGRTYSTTTDKKGEFAIVGVNDGYYQVVITSASGEQLFSGRRNVNRVNDEEAYRRLPSQEQNVLNIDLSAISPSGQRIDAEGNLGHGKLSKDQLEQVRKENAIATQINRLIPQLHSALDVHDWPQALDTLKQLISLDPNRWQFYQNLGMVQNNLYHYQEAAAAFEKAADLAQKLPPNAQDRTQALDAVPGILLSEGDAYNRLDKLDAALDAYKRAASASPNPAVAYFHSCNAQNNHGNFHAAIDLCNQAIQADGTHWEFFQALAAAQSNSGNSSDALKTYDHGVTVARKMVSAQPDSSIARNGLGQMLNSEGNLYAQSRKFDEAITAFTQAAEFTSYPALPYFNLCAALYNANRMPDAIAACDKAIAADPGMADPYFVKASALLGRGRVEHGTYTAPPETRDALNKYLALAPYGQHAADARAMLEKLDTPIQTTYTPRKK
jgi:tetratricopeptide (TPR) repeat protein